MYGTCQHPWLGGGVGGRGVGSLQRVAAGPCHGNLRSWRVTTSAHLQLCCCGKSCCPPNPPTPAEGAQKWALASLFGGEIGIPNYPKRSWDHCIQIVGRILLSA